MQQAGITLAIVLENAVVEMKQPPPTLEALLLELSHADESYSKSRFTLVYMDEENEMVKIENQTDYENAIRYAQIQNIKCLEVNIIMKSKESHLSSGFSAVLTHSVRMGDYRIGQEMSRTSQEASLPVYEGTPKQDKQVAE